MRRAWMIGTMAVGLLASSPVFVTSARHVAQAVEAIQHTSHSLSPVERVVFGLILTNTEARPAAAETPRL